MESGVSVLTGESCLLTLDYGYYHVAFCIMQGFVLWIYGRTRFFRVSHAFGLFALLMDYGIMYMTNNTRQISYPYLAENQDLGPLSGDEPMGPVATLLFFIWFDYSAFGIILWALEVEEYFQNYIINGLADTVCVICTDSLNVFSLLVVPLQFWTAPWLAPALDIDSRTLVLTRTSSKLQYVAMVIVFSVILKYIARLEWRTELLPILLSGFCCGIVHHAPLFLFGMRGYSDLWSLTITLITEWPALVLGVSVVRLLGWPFVCKVLPFLFSESPPPSSTAVPASHSCSSRNGTRFFTALLWLALGAAMYPHFAAIDDKDAMAYLIPLLSGEKMQSVGTAFMRIRTCIFPRVFPATQVDCWDHSGVGNQGNDLLVMASAAKSGAVLSARLVVEIGVACGLCVASGERSAAGIPGPIEDLPVYEGKLLHAIINMRTWPLYAERFGYDMASVSNPNQSRSFQETGRIRCVTLIREPLSRLRSLYTYARSGGEHHFRYKSGIMQQLSNQSISLSESVDLFWSLFGKGYLMQSHEYMMMNIKLGCVPIKMESFKQNYTDTILRILDVYGIQLRAVPHLLDRMSHSDVSLKSIDQQRADAHVTANKFSSKLVTNVKKYLMEMEEVNYLVHLHKEELGYN